MSALTPAAAEGLVAALQRAEAELEWVAGRLEEEFAEACRKGRDVNTLSLLTRLNRLRRCRQRCLRCCPRSRRSLNPAHRACMLGACRPHLERHHAGNYQRWRTSASRC